MSVYEVGIILTKRLIKIIDITIYSVPVAMVIFLSWFTYVHVSVYGHNYYAIIENLDIVIKKPKCAGSFLSAESLRNKFSYKFYLWLALDENKYLNPVWILEKLPDALVSDYFFIGENIVTAQKRLECDFSRIKVSIHPNIRGGFMYFSYVYDHSLIGAFHTGIHAGVDEGEILILSGNLRWGL